MAQMHYNQYFNQFWNSWVNKQKSQPNILFLLAMSAFNHVVKKRRSVGKPPKSAERDTGLAFATLATYSSLFLHAFIGPLDGWHIGNIASENYFLVSPDERTQLPSSPDKSKIRANLGIYTYS